MLGLLESTGNDSKRTRRLLHVSSNSLIRAMIAEEFPIFSELSNFTHRCRAGIETWRLVFFMTLSSRSKNPPRLLPSGTNEGLSSRSLPILKTIYCIISTWENLDERHTYLGELFQKKIFGLVDVGRINYEPFVKLLQQEYCLVLKHWAHQIPEIIFGEPRAVVERV